MTAEQKQAILDRNWNRMIELGGNVYFTSKLGATDGLSFHQLAAMMTGMTQQEYGDMMLHGGRRRWARFKSDWEAHRVARIVAGVATSHVPASALHKW